MKLAKDPSALKIALLIFLSSILCFVIPNIDEYVLDRPISESNLVEVFIPYLLLGMWLGIKSGKLLVSNVRRNAIYLYVLISLVLYLLVIGVSLSISSLLDGSKLDELGAGIAGLGLLDFGLVDHYIAGLAILIVVGFIIFPIISYLVMKLGEFIGYKAIRNMKVFYLLLVALIVWVNIHLIVKPASVEDLLNDQSPVSKVSVVIGKLSAECSNNKVSSCRELGWLYKNATEEEQDIDKAITFFEQACDGGDSGACNDLGWLYKNGSGVTADTELATTAFKRACDLDLPEGCKNLGVIYSLSEYNASENASLFTSMFQNGCSDKKAESCLIFKKAISLYQTGCNNGQGKSCTSLGLSYGVKGGSDNISAAVKLFEQACGKGDGMGCLQLANAYNSGQAVDKNIEQGSDLEKKAVGLFQVACDNDDLDGCTGLGLSYGYGLGVDTDFSKSLALLKKACVGGDAKGCYKMGVMYDEVIGADRNLKHALALFKQACMGGNADGCNSLGLKYRFGAGVERDMGKAQAHFRQACDDGAFGGSMSRDYGCYFNRPNSLEMPFNIHQILPVLPL